MKQWLCCRVVKRMKQSTFLLRLTLIKTKKRHCNNSQPTWIKVPDLIVKLDLCAISKIMAGGCKLIQLIYKSSSNFIKSLTVYNQKSMQRQEANNYSTYFYPFAKQQTSLGYSFPSYSNSMVSEQDELAAKFEHCMIMQDKPYWSNKIKNQDQANCQNLQATPEKSKSMTFKAEGEGLLVTKQKKKKQYEQNRYKTPPRKQRRLTVQELEIEQRQHRYMERRRN